MRLRCFEICRPIRCCCRFSALRSLESAESKQFQELLLERTKALAAQTEALKSVTSDGKSHSAIASPSLIPHLSLSRLLLQFCRNLSRFFHHSFIHYDFVYYFGKNGILSSLVRLEAELFRSYAKTLHLNSRSLVARNATRAHTTLDANQEWGERKTKESIHESICGPKRDKTARQRRCCAHNYACNNNKFNFRSKSVHYYLRLARSSGAANGFLHSKLSSEWKKCIHFLQSSSFCGSHTRRSHSILPRKGEIGRRAERRAL